MLCFYYSSVLLAKTPTKLLAHWLPQDDTVGIPTTEIKPITKYFTFIQMVRAKFIYLRVT
jgi:hypothetical protein